MFFFMSLALSAKDKKFFDQCARRFTKKQCLNAPSHMCKWTNAFGCNLSNEYSKKLLDPGRKERQKAGTKWGSY